MHVSLVFRGRGRHQVRRRNLQSVESFLYSAESNKNVWAYWHNGYNHMPPWAQRNVINLIRRLGPFWATRILDSAPESSTNISRFVVDQQHFFPDSFTSGKISGPYVGAFGQFGMKFAIKTCWRGMDGCEYDSDYSDWTFGGYMKRT